MEPLRTRIIAMIIIMMIIIIEPSKFQPGVLIDRDRVLYNNIIITLKRRPANI